MPITKDDLKVKQPSFLVVKIMDFAWVIDNAHESGEPSLVCVEGMRKKVLGNSAVYYLVVSPLS